tara:strand:- start:6469 stop:6882 length:414 start_codon:yes stop_codon:yes gene_type:complete
MAVYVPLEDPKATATAGAAISEGLFVKYNAAGTKVEVCDGPDKHCAGVAAEAATADGEGIRIFALDQYARVIAGEALSASNGIGDCRLTASAAGKAVKSGASQAVMAIWCPKPGETAADGDFITVQLVQSGNLVLDA